MSDDEVKPPKNRPIAVKPVVAGGWRELGLRWLFEQGFSNVLLVAILVASILGIPKVLIPTINEGYRANAEALDRSAQTYVEAVERLVKVILTNQEKDRETFERAVEAMERNQ